MERRLKFNNITLNIVGDAYAYSVPKESNPTYDKFTHLEIAMWYEDTHNWINPHTDEILANFEQLPLLLEYYEDGEKPVGAYVPVGLIIELIAYLETL